MASKDDLSTLAEAQLLAEYVENVQEWETLDHVGAQNRLMDRRFRILEELKRRSGGTLQPLRALLDHEDLDVRHSAAIHFRTIDHAVFARTMSALAERMDKIGEEARGSLRLDAHFQKVGYPERQEDVPRQSLSWQTRWQSENPPPSGVTRAEVNERLVDALPAAAAGLMRLARPAIGLWPQRPYPDMPIGASRLGGMPHVPPGWTWPMAETEPMLFLGHINCADLHGLPGAEELPSSGLLAFFGDHDSVTGCLLTGNGAAVFHWPDVERLQPAAPAVEPLMVFPLCALTLRPLTDLPDPFSGVVQDILTNQAQVARYSAVRDAVRHHGIPEELHPYCGFAKLLGWPSLVQQYDLDAFGSNPTDLRLLLQLDPYSNGEELEGWGPGGSLYFLLRDRDLRERRFDRCEYDMQFT